MGLRERLLASGADPLKPKTAPAPPKERVYRWRAVNREHYLAKQRGYQKAYRERKKAK